MRKLKLELDQLHVDSFEANQDDPRPRGTVHANSETSTNAVGCPQTQAGAESCLVDSFCAFTCDPFNGWCNQSQGHSPMQTQCDFSCEFAC